MPEIILNGNKKEVSAVTVAKLLKELNITLKYVLVEFNGEAIFHNEYAAVRIKDGDRLEIARPMSGG